MRIPSNLGFFCFQSFSAGGGSAPGGDSGPQPWPVGPRSGFRPTGDREGATGLARVASQHKNLFLCYTGFMTSVRLDVLATPGCQICRVFDEYWHSIEKEWPDVTYRKVDLLTPEGQEMAQRFMIFASPGIVLNDELFATGGFDRKKFVEKLRALSG